MSKNKEVFDKLCNEYFDLSERVDKLFDQVVTVDKTAMMEGTEITTDEGYSATIDSISDKQSFLTKDGDSIKFEQLGVDEKMNILNILLLNK